MYTLAFTSLFICSMIYLRCVPFYSANLNQKVSSLPLNTALLCTVNLDGQTLKNEKKVKCPFFGSVVKNRRHRKRWSRRPEVRCLSCPPQHGNSLYIKLAWPTSLNFSLLRHSGRAVQCISLFHSSQDSTDYITIRGFSTYITILQLTTPTHWRIY